MFESRRFASGHTGAAYSDGDAGWTPVRRLEGKDGMAWANGAGRTLVGGHEGLYVLKDGA